MKILKLIKSHHPSSCPILLVAFSLLGSLSGCGSSGGGPVELETVTNSIGMNFLVVPSGTFMMGSNRGDKFERPVHEATLSQAYGLGMHEVTEQQFTEVMVNNGTFCDAQQPGGFPYLVPS